MHDALEPAGAGKFNRAKGSPGNGA
jgi:hypothetical protein